jgi:hypothetical protein
MEHEEETAVALPTDDVAFCMVQPLAGKIDNDNPLLLTTEKRI